jgi:hypothetical protein
MPSANLTSPHKEAANAVLKASVGLAKADAEFPEDARDKLLIGEDAVETDRFPMSESRRIMGEPRPGQAPQGLHGEGREAVCAPLILAVLRPLLGIPLSGGSPGGGGLVVLVSL